MWWETMSQFQQASFIIACAASVVLVLQIIFMLVGSAGGEDLADGGLDGLVDPSDAADADISGLADTDISDIGDGDISDGADVADGGSPVDHDMARFGFRLLSFRSMDAFLAVGGWVGYTLCYPFEWYIALIIAIVSGTAAACGMAAAMVGMEKLQANGNIDHDNTIGKRGTVYLNIPPRRTGQGKVNVLVQERYAEFEAVTDSADPIPTGADIEVIAHLGSGVLLVKKIEPSGVTVND